MELTKRILTLSTLLLICASAAFAQSSDYVKWEFFGGYSALRGDQQTGIVLAPTPFQTVGTPFVIPGTRQDNLRLSIGIVIH